MKIKHILLILVLPFLINCGNDDDTNNSNAVSCDSNSFKIYDGDITFTTQSALNNFDSFGYTAITGNVEIIEDASSNDPITSLDNLFKCTTTIGGNLRIKDNNSLESLEGFLNNLNSIDGGLRIENNIALESIANSFINLNMLESIYIRDNENLSVLNKFESLNSLTYGVSILNNNALISTAGLCNNVSESVSLRIDGNNSLTDLGGFKQLSSLSTLSIENNPNLIEITGLETLARIRYNVKIVNNDALINIDALSSINSIEEGAIRIVNNDSLLNINGLMNIRAIDVIEIYDNASLMSLSGLENLSYADRFYRSGIYIYDNDSIEHIDELSNVIGINYFFIRRNTSLSNLCGLSHIVLEDSYVGLSIYGNAYNPSINDFVNGQCSL